MAPEVDRTQARAASSISAVSDLDLTDDGNTRAGSVRSRSKYHTGASIMPYELRAKGRTVQTFDTEDEAVAGARELIRTQPDSDPEIWDTTTGKPAAPAASKAWREDLARKIGF